MGKLIIDYAPWSFVGLGVLVIILFIIFISIRKARKRKEEAKAIVEERQRDEELNRLLENRFVSNEYISHENNGYKPIDSDYSVNNLKPVDVKKILKICVHSGVSVKEYVLNPDSGSIIIGRNSTCSVCIPERTVSGTHCELYTSNHKMYAKDCGSSNGTVLKRGMKQNAINGEGIQLKNGDKLFIGEAVIDIIIM